MSNSKKSKTKNIICSLVLSFGLLLSSLSGLTFIKSNSMKASAASNTYTNSYIRENVYSADSSSANYYSFYTTSSSRPASANGWSEINDKQRVSYNEENVVRGIVDLTPNNSAWSSDIYHTSQPSTPLQSSSDKSYFKNLMINSYNGSSAFGYKSNSISLEADSYYSIAVTLYTHKVTNENKTIDPTASIYLQGLVDEESELIDQVKYENISTLGDWKTYKFYISTEDSTSVNLELWLGSEDATSPGAVFFNNVEIVRYSEAYYHDFFVNELTDEANDNHNFIELKRDYKAPVSNSSFESVPDTAWTKLEQSTSNGIDQISNVVDVINFNYSDEKTTVTSPGSNCAGENESALFLYNKVSSYQGIESTEIQFKQHSYYKLSFWAKSNCNSGDGATVKLVDKSENPLESASITLATTYTENSNKFRNDWTQYSFYVYGPATGTKNATIQIWLGTADKPTTGYVFIDDFRLEEIDYTEFKDNSSASNAKALNFNGATDNFKVENSYFDKTQNAEESPVYPLAPAGWTKSGNNDNTFSGVINTNPTHFDANVENYYSYGVAPNNPGKLDYMTSNDNNVLMIGSISETNSQTYTSTSIDISTSSYYRISFYIKTSYVSLNNNTDAGASVKLTSGTKTLFEYRNIEFDDEQWHKFEIYIKSGSVSYTSNLAFTFEKLNGYIFIDDVKVESSTENAYNNYGYYQDPAIEYVKVDLSYENFDNRTYNSNLTSQTPNNWTAKEQNDKVVNNTGIIGSNDEILNDFSSSPSNNANVLYIDTTKDVNYYYTSKDTYTFSASTYYKVSVNVLTKNLYQENKKDGVNYGASFGLADYDNKNVYITGIDTNGEWKTYNLYVCLTTDTTSAIALGLGYTDELTSGFVVFDNLKIETIDEATFASEIANPENNFNAFINHAEETEDDEEESTWENKFDWLIIPSLLTALAIIIAIIGFYVRKINWSRKPKIKTKYDRRKTLDRDIDKREKIALRKQIIAELNEELLAIDKEIEEYNALAEQQLAQVKEKILQEQEEIKRKKLDIEIRKAEAKAERESKLKENPELVSNAKAEKDYINYINKLDKQEMSLQKQLTATDVKLANVSQGDKAKLNKYLERKEFIKNEIAKIEIEIEEITKEEKTMWEEYKEAKKEAKRQKAEYKELLEKYIRQRMNTKNK